ncbi:vWA domain-containing protein [Nannocystis pusilla]|uniref:VWA domain-containing protein n=1 Tax=Nannocystis pusilla TaxID=889268 RepID=A0ABS7U6M5_9BACT|nr:vWA domain-containing protein [Nannocystis pusilla]MBZ5716064.1 VWA domain-containing protein [Nannocystis pusilla]
MPKASAAPGDPCGWGIQLTFLGRTVAQLGAGDAAPITLGERKDCDLVLPGLGERTVLTDGATLVVPAGLVGELQVGERTQPAAEGRVTLAPGDRASLRVAAHPDIALEIQRVTREHLPWSARFHARDLARQLVTGAALVAMAALLWRVETVENVLKLRGDPRAEDVDSLLLRVMFAPTEEPVEVVRAREFYAAYLPPPPPPAAPPVEPGEDVVTTGPTPLGFAVVGAEEGEPPAPDHADQPPIEKARPSKTVRRSKRARPEPELVEYAVLSVLDSGTIDTISTDGSIPYGGMIAALGGEGGGGLGEGVEGGEVGGVVGGVLGGVEAVPMDMALAPGPEGPVPGLTMKSTTGGLHSHDDPSGEALKGELDGVAAAVAAASCPDPAVVRKQQIDVVFAVDVSTTMNFMLGKIGREIAAVDATVRAHNLDARYGLVVFVDDVMVTHGGQPFADLAALQQELTKWQHFTASNRQIGAPESNLDWPENTLDALHAAATRFAWRDPATTLRAVIHATDDDFGEAPAIQSGQAVQHSYRETVAALQAAAVRVFSFAAKVGGQCECLDVRPGLFVPYRGQQAIPAATGGAVFDIDEVASGALDFGAAVSGALQTAVCTHYPLSPFAGKKP